MLLAASLLYRLSFSLSMLFSSHHKMASNAIFRKIAYFGRNPFPDFLPKCLLVTYPQTPEIIAGGNGCAFRWNAENQKQTNLIDGIFLCCAAVVVGKKSLIDIPHWPEHYEVLSYHFWPAYRQNRLSVFVPEDRCIPLGEI